MTSVLTLSPYAKLVRHGDESVSMLFDGIRFTRDEQLPVLLHESDSSQAAKYSAASFVAECVEREFGRNSHKWPEIAVRFLFAEVVTRRDFSNAA